MSDSPPRPLSPPPLESVDDDEAFLDSGHVWLYEYPDGTPFAVRLATDGGLRFAFADADPSTERQPAWVGADEVPSVFGFAVRSVRARLDRTALERAVEDPTAVTLHCVALHCRHRGYDWSRAPPVVGIAVDHSGSNVLPHELDRVLDGLGVPSPPTIDTEVHVRDLGQGGITPPETQWGDGTAYGVLYRKKGGRLVSTVATAFAGVHPDPAPIESSLEEYAATVASNERLTSLASAFDGGPSVSTLTDAALDRALRADFGRLTHAATPFDIESLRSAIAPRVDEHLRRTGE